MRRPGWIAVNRTDSLVERSRDLGRVNAGTQLSGSREQGWDAPTLVYSERPVIESQLDALETGSAADAFLVLTGAGRVLSPQFPPHRGPVNA